MWSLPRLRILWWRVRTGLIMSWIISYFIHLISHASILLSTDAVRQMISVAAVVVVEDVVAVVDANLQRCVLSACFVCLLIHL